MKLDEFIEIVKDRTYLKQSPYKVHKGKIVHYMGKTILTNQELDHMLKIMLKEDYTSLNGTQREKMREKVFNACRGDTNVKE